MKAAIYLLLILTACNAHREELNFPPPSITLEAADTSLHFINGSWFRKNSLFTGTLNDRYPNNSIYHRTVYVEGKEEGWMYGYFPEGTLLEKRYYHQGQKDSVHTGWWPNGKLRFEYHFTAGMYNGDFKEWYADGAKYKLIHYSNGKEVWGKGWRQNGKIYMNFMVKNGRRYGLENSNLCYTVKNEKGEYVSSETIK